MRVVGFADLRIKFNSKINNSVDSWEKCVQEFSEAENHTIVRIFVSGFKGNSGSYNSISGDFKKLVNYFRSPDVNPALIIIPDSRHLANNLVDLVENLLEIHSLKCRVECVNSKWNDPLHDGLNRLGLKGALTQLEIKRKEAIRFKITRGEVVTKIPIGYKIGDEGNLVIDSDYHHIVEKIFSLYSGVSIDKFNESGSQLGLRKIAIYLNNNGFKTKAGNWWSPSSVDIILRNRTYTGVFQRSGVIITNNHPYLITQDMFDKAENVRISRKINRKLRENRVVFRKSLIRCGICSGNMNYKNIMRIWTRKGGDIHRKNYGYYYCSSVYCSGDDLNNINFENLFKEIVNEILTLARSLRKNLGADYIYWNISMNLDSHEKRKFIEQKFMVSLRSVSRGKKSLSSLLYLIQSMKSIDLHTELSEKDEIIDMNILLNELDRTGPKNRERIVYLINNLTDLIIVRNNSVKVTLKEPTVGSQQLEF